jgi:integrase
MGKTIDDGEDPLFVSPKGNYLNYSNFRNRVFLPAVERAGLGKRTIQDIRRTVGTLLAQSELDMKSVATHMGHSEFRTTLKFYVAETVEGRQRVNSVIEGFLGTDLNDGTLEEAN